MKYEKYKDLYTQFLISEIINLINYSHFRKIFNELKNIFKRYNQPEKKVNRIK